jgi:thiol-disulfide isomerase/thioredoxin
LFFYIEGCPPCEEQKPVINELMQEYSRHVVFMDIDMSGPVVLEELGARESPTMLLITAKDAEGEYVVYGRFEDVTGKETLIDSIERALLEE